MALGRGRRRPFAATRDGSPSEHYGACVRTVTGRVHDDAVGVYGLTVTGLGRAAASGAGPATCDGPRLHVDRLQAAADHGVVSRLFDGAATIPLLDGGWLHVSREPPVATYHLTRMISDEEMLHPWLVPAAATVSAWHGRSVLHGGLVGRRGRALALIGDKGGGKSTLLAWLALEAGLDVLADDLVVFSGHLAFAGPRSIDLRPAAAELLGTAREARPVRDGTRHRLALRDAGASAELVGLVVLEWHDGPPRLVPVPVAQRLPVLLPHALVEGVPLGEDGILAFARHRTWRLQRPRRWGVMPSCAALIREALDAS